MIWIHNIGPAIVASLWQSAIGYLVLFLMRKSNKFKPNQSYVIGLLIQLMIVCAFFFNVFNAQKWQASFFPIESQYGTTNQTNFLNLIITSNYISIIYIVFLIINFVFFIRKNRIDRRNLPEKNECDFLPEIEKNILYWKERLGIKRSIQIIINENILVPFTKGVLKPALYLPICMINGLSPKQNEAIILHELSHIKRHDYLFLILQTCAEKLLYFNPFFLRIGKAINEDREIACDINSINITKYNSISYIESLLFFSKLNHSNESLALPIAGKHTNELTHRVNYILERKNTHRFHFSWKLNVIIFLTLFIQLFGNNIPDQNTIVKKATQANKINFASAAFENRSVKINISNKKERSYSNKNKISKNIDNQYVINKKKVSKRKTNTQNEPQIENSRNADAIEITADNKQKNNAIVQLASYIENSQNSNKIKFRKISSNQNKALFVLENLDKSGVDNAYNMLVQNIKSKFSIESSSYEYTTYEENDQSQEFITTLLQSNNYRFLLIKRNDVIFLAIVDLSTQKSAS